MNIRGALATTIVAAVVFVSACSAQPAADDATRGSVSGTTHEAIAKPTPAPAGSPSATPSAHPSQATPAPSATPQKPSPSASQSASPSAEAKPKPTTKPKPTAKPKPKPKPKPSTLSAANACKKVNAARKAYNGGGPVKCVWDAALAKEIVNYKLESEFVTAVVNGEAKADGYTADWSFEFLGEYDVLVFPAAGDKVHVGCAWAVDNKGKKHPVCGFTW